MGRFQEGFALEVEARRLSGSNAPMSIRQGFPLCKRREPELPSLNPRGYSFESGTKVNLKP